MRYWCGHRWYHAELVVGVRWWGGYTYPKCVWIARDSTLVIVMVIVVIVPVDTKIA